MDLEKDIYVVVAKNDQPHKMPNTEIEFFDNGGPLIFEQYVRTADLENITKRAEQLAIRFGKCQIAKLQFITP